MQLIPFVLVVFFLLSLTTLSSYNKVSRHIQFQERVLYHLSIEQKLQQEALDTFFEASFKQENENKKKTKNRTSIFHNRREKGYLLNSRLVIKPLFTRNDPVLKKLASRFLQLLYPSSLGFDSDALLEEILEKGAQIIESKPKTPFFTLYDLIEPSQELLRAIEGKPGYRFGQKDSYPPLGDYLEIFPKSDRSPVCSLFASTPLLFALFSEKGSKKILEEESKRFLEDKHSPYCNKKDLQELFLSDTTIDTKIWSLIADQTMRGSKEGELELIVIDPKLRLEARGTLRTFPLKRGDLQEGAPSQTPSIPGV